MHMKAFRKRGFTLIELLVVIAIIAILAAILFPVFAQAREKARQSSCLSNEKQISQAMMMFAQDHDEQFPGGAITDCYSYGWGGTTYNYCYGPNNSNGPGWSSNIQPYVKNFAVFKCPDDGTRGTKITANKLTSPVSYIYNADLVITSNSQSGTTYTSVPAGLPQAALIGPSKTVLLMEGINDEANIGATNEQPTGSSQNYSAIGDGASGSLSYGQSRWGAVGTSPAQYDTGYMSGGGVPSNKSEFHAPTGRHSGGANYAFCDGHVKFVKSENVSVGGGQYWQGYCYGDPGRDGITYSFTWGGYTIPAGPLSSKAQAVMCPF